MAFIRKQDTTSGDQFKFETPGTALIGVYLGSFPHEGDYGPTKKHLFKTEKGIKVVFGQKHLSDLLENETAGSLVRVTFTESKKMRKGNPMKMYTLDIDNEYQADPSEVESYVEAATAGADDDSLSDDDTPADEVVTEPVKAKVVARAPSAEAQARVQALLARNKKAS